MVNVRRSCRLALLRPSAWHATSEARDQSAPRLRVREIAMERPRFGFLRVLFLPKREGWEIGKRRVYRLYRLEGLQLHMKVSSASASACSEIAQRLPQDRISTGAWTTCTIRCSTDNGFIESFNGRLRDEFLNFNEFIAMRDAREIFKAWQDDHTIIVRMDHSAT